MAISDKPWHGQAANFKDAEAYCRSCLVDMNEAGKPKVKDNCHLPVREEGGAVNRSGVHAAAAALSGARGGVKIPAAEKKKAAKRLLGLYRELKATPPDSLKRLAE